MMEVKISVVCPVYKGERTIDTLTDMLQDALSCISDSFEIIYVDDCGPDKSWERVQAICNKHSNVVGLKLSRNFGQHYAITAGLVVCKGEWIVILDCDLQDDPNEIKKLYYKALEGHDIVLAQRVLRKDGAMKKLSSRLFYSVLGYLTDTEQDSSVANFGVYNRKVIDAILSMGDSVKFFPTMMHWVGFSRCYLPVNHSACEGGTSYTWGKLLSLALDNIVAFSTKPLMLTIKLGVMVLILSVIYGCYVLWSYCSGEISELGYASLILSIWFLSGVIIFTLGVVGLYVGKSFETVKRRPTYIVDKSLNLE